MPQTSYDRRFETIDRIIETGIYLYILFMFLSKGEAIRNILIFGNFTLWLTTLRYRKNLSVLKEPVSVIFWIFTAVTVLSVPFSIEPLYSFFSLRNDPLKPALLFAVIATVITDRERIVKVSYVSFVAVFIIVVIGYYSYIAHDLAFLRPDVSLMHTGQTGHNRFARYLNTLLPLIFILYYVWDRSRVLKWVLSLLFIAAVFALILSTSREGYLAFLGMVGIYTFYVSRTRGYKLVKVIAGVSAVIILLGAVSWFFFPNVRERMARIDDQLPTLNLRTEAWKPAFDAIMQRPAVGWGVGDRIFRLDEPYHATPYKGAPPRTSEGSPKGPHNTFIKILFHQGLIGVVPYILLILYAMRTFWTDAFRKKGLTGFLLIACVAVIFGNYILNSLLADLELRYLAVILGLGMAATRIDETGDR
jgi:O-antigen ligase